MIRADETKNGHLILLLLLASIEQYKLDGAWMAAWRMTQLTAPPFSDWRSKEHSIGQLKADNPHSRLIPATWAATVIAQLKDEETLMKRRSPGGPGFEQGAGCYGGKFTEPDTCSGPPGG